MGDEQSRSEWRTTLRSRLFVCAGVLAFWTVALEARLVYLQVVQHEELTARANRQQLRTVTPPAKRGDILDRNGRVLAYSVDADSIFADPSEITDRGKVAQLVCGALDRCDARERQAMLQALGRDTQFV
jgi:cell division protein FtsI (penicillin-binding protein 3)